MMSQQVDDHFCLVPLHNDIQCLFTLLIRQLSLLLEGYLVFINLSFRWLDSVLECYLVFIYPMNPFPLPQFFNWYYSSSILIAQLSYYAHPSHGIHAQKNNQRKTKIKNPKCRLLPPLPSTPPASTVAQHYHQTHQPPPTKLQPTSPSSHQQSVRESPKSASSPPTHCCQTTNLFRQYLHHHCSPQQPETVNAAICRHKASISHHTKPSKPFITLEQ